MIYSITGKLRLVTPAFCVVETGGMGFRCAASANTLGQLPARGSEVTLFTHLAVREDAMELYAFATEQEKKCFQLLIGVSGVGPRVALAILSDSTPDRLMLAVAAGDVKAITRAQGVGPKIAQRIILELKDKAASEGLAAELGGSAGAVASMDLSGAPSAKAEAVSALVALGYGQSDAAAVIAKEEDGLPVDELVRRGLKAFMRSK